MVSRTSMHIVSPDKNSHLVCWDTYYSLDISGSTRARKCIQKFFGRRHKLCTNIQVWLILRWLRHEWEVSCARMDRSSVMEKKEANSWHRYQIKLVPWGVCLYLGFDGHCHVLQKRVSGCIITQLLALQVAVLLDYLHCSLHYYWIADVAEYVITVLLVLLELKINLLVCNKTTEFYIQLRCMCWHL